MTRRKDPLLVRKSDAVRVDWTSTPNARRKRPMVMITISPEGLEALDRLRGAEPRGAYIEALLSRADESQLIVPGARRFIARHVVESKRRRTK